MDNPSQKPNPPESPKKEPSNEPASGGAPQQPGVEREIRHPDGRIEHPSVRSEPHSLPFTWIMAVIVVIITTGAVIFYVVWIFFVAREQQQQSAKASNYPLAPSPAIRLPAEPRLEPLDRLSRIEASNIYDREMANEQKLASYGPTEESGYVHIPIQEAIKLIVPKLRVRSQPSQDDTYKGNGLLDAGEPNSGRVYQETSP
jgi:hypothetical protein